MYPNFNSEPEWNDFEPRTRLEYNDLIRNASNADIGRWPWSLIEVSPIFRRYEDHGLA